MEFSERDKQLYTRNPETGRLIGVGGPTFNRISQDYNFSPKDFISGRKWSKTYQQSPPSIDNLAKIRKMSPNYPINIHRGNRTKGWGYAAPKRGRERNELLEKCGNKCFLIPENKSFPICSYCPNNQCDCKLDCRGLAAAKIRAHQWKYTNLYDTIDELGISKCGWPEKKSQ